MLSKIRECIINDGFTDVEDINSRVISKIITSNKAGKHKGDDSVVRFEWRDTMINADTDASYEKAYVEEVYCQELRKWCADHGMLFKTDVGRVEEKGYRGIDYVLMMPGAEYLRLLGETMASTPKIITL